MNRQFTMSMQNWTEDPLYAEALATLRENRRSERKVFSTMQLIAPYRDGDQPQLTNLQQCRCNDLSTSGFSFFWPTEPDFQNLVVVMIGAAGPLYITARIARCTDVEDEEGQQYLVGCQFTGRFEG